MDAVLLTTWSNPHNCCWNHKLSLILNLSVGFWHGQVERSTLDLLSEVVRSSKEPKGQLREKPLAFSQIWAKRGAWIISPSKCWLCHVEGQEIFKAPGFCLLGLGYLDFFPPFIWAAESRHALYSSETSQKSQETGSIMAGYRLLCQPLSLPLGSDVTPHRIPDLNNNTPSWEELCSCVFLLIMVPSIMFSLLPF